MIKLEVNKGVSVYQIDGENEDIAAEIAAAMVALEEIIVKEFGISQKLAPLLLMAAYRKASRETGGKYDDKD